MGPEILQKYDEAVKRFNENKVQAKAKPAPRGGAGVTASMIVLEPDEEGDASVSCAAVSVSEDYYAMMDSGTNAIVVPLHPNMCGEIADCRVPSSIVQGPIVQGLGYHGERRLVVALPQSAILISQEWLTTVASWAVIAKSVGTLPIKNGLLYLSKDRFWDAMQDISAQNTLVTGHPWPELKELIHE